MFQGNQPAKFPVGLKLSGGFFLRAGGFLWEKFSMEDFFAGETLHWGDVFQKNLSPS